MWDWTPFGSDAAEDNLQPQFHDKFNKPDVKNVMPYIQDIREKHGANPYRDVIIINATDEQVAAINQYARNIEANDPNYNLASYNCLTFVKGALNAAGIKSPSEPVPDKWHLKMLDLYG